MNRPIPIAQREIDIRSEDKRFTAKDARLYGAKLLFAGALMTLSGIWILTHGWLAALPAQVVLGVLYAHCTELQHQALHGTGFRGRSHNRLTGALLGMPMLISYSRYRSLHLLHHRHLGTAQDTEFFTYSIAEKLTLWTLFTSAFNLSRWGGAVRDIFRSLSPRAEFDQAIKDPGVYRRIRVEYRWTLSAALALSLLSWWLDEPLILTLWLIPLCFAEPTHFLIELPEHFQCDRTTTDVFRNTRSVSGTRFSFWLTNGNNLHVEHHLRMGMPINKLPRLHPAIVGQMTNYNRTYPDLYRTALRLAWRNSIRDRSQSH
jgi:fatty acid desaturase